MLPRRQTLRATAGRVEYVLSGSGRCTLVLLSGAGVTLEGWGRRYPDTEGIGRVVAWNRFGAGASSGPALPQTGTTVVDT